MSDESQSKQQAAEQLQKHLLAAQRLHRLKRARDSLLDFTWMSMPHPEDPDDSERSRYVIRPHHRYLCEKLEQVENGEVLRLIINIQPRAGKSELVSKRLPAWFVGRDPYRQVAVGSYGDSLAEEFGEEVREVMRSPFYQQVFPGAKLKKGSQAKDKLKTTGGGSLNFVGVGTGLTGKGADLLIIDDPIKDDVEAQSRAIRDKTWNWFTKVAMTRLMGRARVVICMTRWHSDDVVGRLTDPKNPYYNEAEAKKWTVVNIPAFAEEDDPIGRKPGEILWPERTSREFLESYRALDPGAFAALYMGRPSPPEGNFFKRSHIQGYKPEQLPRNLRMYAASDHAVSLEENRDPTCMGAVGVDEDDNIWVMPDLVWRQISTDVAVDEMLQLMKEHEPLLWWAEKGHISKSIGPFLYKRMIEEGVYCSVDEKTPAKDKMTRARSIQARMSMGKVYLPEFAPWYQDAVDQLLNFPNDSHDDFVDFIAWIGIGLSEQVKAGRAATKKETPKTGTFAWIKASSEALARSKDQPEARYLH